MSPAAGFRKDVNPLSAPVQLVKSLIESLHPSSCLRDWNTSCISHKPGIIPHQMFSIYRKPHLSELHRVEDADHIPSVNVVADCHSPVSEQIFVLLEPFLAFEPDTEPQPVEWHNDVIQQPVVRKTVEFVVKTVIQIRIGFVESNSASTLFYFTNTL